MVKGCPARAPPVKALLRLVQVRAKQKGAAATRLHVEAMKLKDLETILDWSESQCPIETAQAFCTSRTGSPQIDHATSLKHVMMRAFLSSGFTLWMRKSGFRSGRPDDSDVSSETSSSAICSVVMLDSTAKVRAPSFYHTREFTS